MKRVFCHVTLLLTFICMSFVILAAETFVVDDIRVEGLERITPGAIFNYLPIGVGDELDEIKIKSIVDFLTDVKVQIFMTDIGNKKLPLSEQKSSTFNIKNGVITAF